MEKSLFRELMASAEEALEHAQGKRELRTTELPAEPKPMSASDIRGIRDHLQASQAVFARCLNVSTKLVQAWEAGRRKADGPALRLLWIGSSNPNVVFEGLMGKPRKAAWARMAKKSKGKRAGNSGRKRATVGA